MIHSGDTYYCWTSHTAGTFATDLTGGKWILLSTSKQADWLSATGYALNDLVQQGGRFYVFAVAHTSGTFADDLLAGNWLLVPLSNYKVNQTYHVGELCMAVLGSPT